MTIDYLENVNKEMIKKAIEYVKRGLIETKKRVKVISDESGSITIFKRVTDVIEASVALEDPEIRSGTKKNLLYIIEGVLDFTDDKYVSEVVKSFGNEEIKIMICVYNNTTITFEEPVAVF